MDRLDEYVRRGEIVQIRQYNNYYAPVAIGDINTIASGQSQIATSGGMAAGRDTGDVTPAGGAEVRQGGAAAEEASAAAHEGHGTAMGESTTRGVFDRAKKSRSRNTWALVSLVVLAITIALVVVGAIGLDWAGFIVAALVIVVGVIPLFSEG